MKEKKITTIAGLAAYLHQHMATKEDLAQLDKKIDDVREELVTAKRELKADIAAISDRNLETRVEALEVVKDDHARRITKLEGRPAA